MRVTALGAATLAAAALLAAPAGASAHHPARCGQSSTGSPGSTTTHTLTSGGVQRSYRLHLPDGYRQDRPTALILSFHGRTRTAEYQEQLTGMSGLPAILVYPQGTVGNDGQPSWQGAPYSSGADDVQFTSDLITQLQRDLCVDPARVYATGKSNGGGFAALLACRLAGRIAAAAPVSGAFYPQGGACNPVRPVPIIDFHGGADTTIPYAGDATKGLPALPDWLAGWAGRSRCRAGARSSTPVAGVTRLAWPGCAADVVHYRVDALGHTWPSTTPNNDSATPTVLDATPLIWKFFREHPLAGAPVVNTAGGLLRGYASAGVEAFLGVPYAAAPLGDRRFRAPQPAPGWSGIRPASAFGANCPQGDHGSEDCLFLNVYRPAGTRSGDRRPVFFWIHGGGFTGGSGDQDGSALARTNRMIVVTVNYRLGALGFLADPALAAADGSAGNYGLMDQQAALRWVRRNAQALGANPGKVTIGGESAGGGSVCAQLTSPAATELFRAAVIESDDCLHDVDSLAHAQQRGAAIVAGVGCADATDVAACLRAAPVAALIRNTGYIAPNTSGRTLPAVPVTAIATGRWNKVPVLLGSNREEGRSFATFATGYNEAHYRQWLAAGPAWPPAPGTVSFGADAAERIAERYPLANYPAPYPAAYAIGAVITDSGTRGLGGCTQLSLAQQLSRQTPTYYYQFEDPSPPRLSSTPADFDYAAAHAYELPYLWPGMKDGSGQPFQDRMSRGQRQLSDRMIRAWGSFVNRGSPETNWPALRGGDGRLVSLQPGPAHQVIRAGDVSRAHHCDLWDQLMKEK
ncbi:carboxylesterase type B/predicted esterase [Actinoplanes octamycinicus]|uniref:Carboxylesterase type B/predicted esterase n=1 Tax=Actinoplanes octamycinicus TaxID=135948 RepID=A0A7W7H4M4_9ACTN|nr:carboxylesterase family protein [Actinoplanes octamycinicus]MBB4743920.1 carboxylesterase type B/predicted esterase [Actinoplanes octamycinicus]GIE58547.1 hypothetical protein Aoc01nite_39490 [Actinoplanes octamycinicus]